MAARFALMAAWLRSESLKCQADMTATTPQHSRHCSQPSAGKKRPRSLTSIDALSESLDCGWLIRARAAGSDLRYGIVFAPCWATRQPAQHLQLPHMRQSIGYWPLKLPLLANVDRMPYLKSRISQSCSALLHISVRLPCQQNLGSVSAVVGRNVQLRLNKSRTIVNASTFKARQIVNRQLAVAGSACDHSCLACDRGAIFEDDRVTLAVAL
jgi:hypothetical protein